MSLSRAIRGSAAAPVWHQRAPVLLGYAGDVIVVRIGDIVPADIKLLGDESDTSSPLQVCSPC